MCVRKRRRHQFRCLAAGIAKHHALVTCANSVGIVRTVLLIFIRRINTHRNIWRLLVYWSKYCTGFCIKPILRAIISRPLNCFSYNSGNIRITVGTDLPHDKDRSGRSHRLTGNPRIRITADNRIQNRIRNLIAKLIRMSFCNRFWGKKLMCHTQQLLSKHSRKNTAVLPLVLLLFLVYHDWQISQ